MTGIEFPSILVLTTTLAFDEKAVSFFTIPKYSFALAVIISWAVYLVVIERGAFYRRPTFLILVLALWIGWCFFTNPQAGHSTVFDYYLLSLLGASSAFVGLRVRQYRWKHFLRTLSLVAVIQGAIGIIQAVYFFDPDHFLSVKKMVGTVGLPNAYATILGLGICSLIMDTDFKNERVRKCLVLFLVVSLFLTRSRGGIIATMLAMGLYVLMNVRFSLLLAKRWHLIACLGLAILLIAGLIQLDPESLRGRFFIWDVTKSMVTDHPLTGVGYGRFGVEYLRYQAEYFVQPHTDHLVHKATLVTQAHNEFLESATRDWRSRICSLLVCLDRSIRNGQFRSSTPTEQKLKHSKWHRAVQSC